jgi:hypothetical protein
MAVVPEGEEEVLPGQGQQLEQGQQSDAGAPDTNSRYVAQKDNLELEGVRETPEDEVSAAERHLGGSESAGSVAAIDLGVQE